MKKALIIVDVQNDYFPAGKMELALMNKAAKNTKIVLDAFRKKKLPVIHIQHISIQPDATFFIPETEGVKINEKVAPVAGEIIIQKNYPSSFRETTLESELKTLGVEDLVICGAMSHMCIDTTVRAAFDLGFKCTLVVDGCATRDLEFDGIKVEAAAVQASFMSAITAVFAQPIKSYDIEQVLNELFINKQ